MVWLGCCPHPPAKTLRGFADAHAVRHRWFMWWRGCHPWTRPRPFQRTDPRLMSRIFPCR